MEDISALLRKNGVEIDLGDHRSPEDIAIALGLIAVNEQRSLSEEQAAQPVALAKRPKDSPYLAY